MAADDHAQIASLKKRLAELDGEREELLASLEQLQQRNNAEAKRSSSQVLNAASAATTLSNAEKVTLFRSFFRGRDDVFPLRWENSKSGKAGYSPACHNEWVRGICEKPRVKCSDCLNQAFVPVTDDVARSHLQGRDLANPKRTGGFVAGVYPLLADGTCWFLAADFDKQHWQRDALAFLTTCREIGVPAALERSRSGNGGHVWIFFSEPVSGSEARTRRSSNY
jgi:hypothetical protein